MHGQFFYVVVFAASFYAALAVGRLYLAARATGSTGA